MRHSASLQLAFRHLIFFTFVLFMTVWLGTAQAHHREKHMKHMNQVDHNPIANNDTATVNQGDSINIDVVANDTALDDIPVTVSINFDPKHGAAVAESNNTVTYVSDPEFLGEDSFLYEVTDADGDSAVATVTITIMGNPTGSNQILRLSWKHPSPDTVEGYFVYAGPGADTATQQVADLPVNAGSFDPQNPSLQFNAADDLGASTGDNVCFRVKAYNTSLESDFSEAVCTVI